MARQPRYGCMAVHRSTSFTPYRNRVGDSGVVAYATGKDWIEIVFEDRKAIYRYSHKKPGRAHVMRMMALARQGEGLAAYIEQHVRNNYENRRNLARIAG